MNKKDVAKLCRLIVDWEFQDGGTSSEAVGRNSCIRQLRDEFNISNDDLSFYRVLQICEKVGDDSDDLFDAVCDLVDDDYEGLLDAIDDAGSFEVVKTLANQWLSARSPH